MTEPIDDVALSATSVFALSGANTELLQIDPRSLRVSHRWSLQAFGGVTGFGPVAHSLVAGPKAAYVDFRTVPAQVARFDERTHAVLAVKLPATFGSAKSREIADGGGSVWVTDGVALDRLDATDLTSRGLTTLPIPIDDLWFGDGSLWGSSERPLSGVLRIDASSGCATLKAMDDAAQIAFSTQAVWLAADRGPVALDPVSAEDLAALPFADVPDGSASGIAVVGNEVWTSYYEVGLQRIGAAESPIPSP